MALTPFPELLDRRLQRISGTLTQLFPLFNNDRELILRQMQNDAVLSVMSTEDKRVSELLLKPNLQTHSSVPTSAALMLVRSINVLRSLVIHLLLLLHTYNLNPHFLILKNQLLPFLKDCLEIHKQYETNELGPPILWGLWKNKQEELKKILADTEKELASTQKRYNSLWKDLLGNS